jgi:DNA mismatch endonuclease (patch repair protein)
MMGRIRGKDTKGEVLLRKYLFAHGFRYRKNDRSLPGSPDIVLPRYRTVIFFNGCFWHGHEGCPKFVLPKTNTEFWQKKIERNRRRDLQVRQKLQQMGYRVFIVWECELATKERRELTLQGLVNEIYDLQGLEGKDPRPARRRR